MIVATIVRYLSFVAIYLVNCHCIQGLYLAKISGSSSMSVNLRAHGGSADFYGQRSIEYVNGI